VTTGVTQCAAPTTDTSGSEAASKAQDIDLSREDIQSIDRILSETTASTSLPLDSGFCSSIQCVALLPPPLDPVCGVTQQARQLAWTFPGARADPIPFLIRDRDNNSGPVSMLTCCPSVRRCADVIEHGDRRHQRTASAPR
jgi:hypothetical protein